MSPTLKITTRRSANPSSLFVIGLDQVALPRIVGKGDRFLDKYYITNDFSFVKQLIDHIRFYMGTLEYGFLTGKCAAVIYRADELSDDDFSAAVDSADARIMDCVNTVTSLLYQMWIFKDNAASSDRGWLYLSRKSEGMCHSNYNLGRNSCANGKKTVVAFNAEELKNLRLASTALGIPKIASQNTTALSHETSKYERFTLFLQAARENTDLGIKVSQYITALEALVSTSSSELSHQVAERVACLITERGQARVDVYRKLKGAYNFRSKVVHGDTINTKQFEKLTDCSEFLDQACRAVLFKFVMNSDTFRDAAGNPQLMDEFFLKRLMGD